MILSTKEVPKQKADNDIHIGMNSRLRNIIHYSTAIMKEKNLRELKLCVVGGLIGRLFDTTYTNNIKLYQ